MSTNKLRGSPTNSFSEAMSYILRMARYHVTTTCYNYIYMSTVMTKTKRDLANACTQKVHIEHGKQTC